MIFQETKGYRIIFANLSTVNNFEWTQIFFFHLQLSVFLPLSYINY